VLLRRGLLVAITLLAACGDDAPPDGGLCIVGDPTQPAVLQVVAHGLAPLPDGGTILLETPPQGGHVIFAGVRVKNANLCGATLQAALRDPCSGRVVGLERRPIAWRLADDGFAEPAQPEEISDYANIPACPNAAIDHDVDGHPLQLEIRLYEESRMTETILTVTPTCADGDTYCTCDCDSDYDLGGECPVDPDGGVACPDAGP
jgi:hypothetical protein